MDKELEQAVQTFGMVPEFYQKAFQDAGAEFPDELVEAIKADPNKAGELVSSDEGLMKAVLTIFKSNKDAIAKYIQEQSGSVFKKGGKFDYLMKLQTGGSLTRREMFKQANANRGFSKSNARAAYRNARNTGLDRQTAMRAVVGSKPQLARVEVDNPQVTINPAKVDNDIGLEPIEYTPEFEIPEINYSNLGFKDAFRLNRQAGNKDFMWRGKRYTTELAKNTTPVETEVKPIVKVFQRGIEPIVEDIRWNNEHRPYWADLKKQGGKLEQENNIRKNYIKDSKEAAEESSEKMKKISNKYDKKLDKVQKEQFGGSISLDSELQRIPKYGHLGLLRKRNPINTSKIDSTFTFIPENKNSYSVPEGTYTRTNYDNEPLYRGFMPNRSDSYQEGAPAIRNFNALRQLWEYAKQNNK